MKQSGGELFKRVKELGGLSAFMLYLAETGSERLSVTQASFFFLVATANARGVPLTLSQIKEEFNLNKSIHNTYKVLLPPSRRYPAGLGWVDTKANPDDEREKFLILTDKGKAVLEGVAIALAPLEI